MKRVAAVLIGASLLWGSPSTTQQKGEVVLPAGVQQLTPQQSLELLKVTPIYQRIAPLIQKGIVKVRGVEEGEFYILQVKTPRGSGNIYITKDKKYTILGQVIENKSGAPLLPKFPINRSVVEKGILFSFGNGKKELYLVTDPQCPFCRMMERKTAENLEKNYRVHVILLPLSFHRNARQMSYYILAGKNEEERAKRLKAILSGSSEWKNYTPTPEEKAKFEAELQKSERAAEELGARGTPSVYDANFTQFPWSQLIPKGK